MFEVFSDAYKEIVGNLKNAVKYNPWGVMIATILATCVVIILGIIGALIAIYLPLMAFVLYVPITVFFVTAFVGVLTCL